jgi:hypothetical protein
VGYTPTGQRHVRLVQDYRARIERVAKPLYEDCVRFRPVAGVYSPYGALYGFSTDLIEHMALKTLAADAVTQFSLEDVFAAGDADSGKLAWVNGWRKLPHLKPEVVTQFDYPQQFAEGIFGRIEQALRKRVSEGGTNAGNPIGRLFVQFEDRSVVSEAPPIPELPVRYIRSSDPQLVAARKAEPQDESRLLSDRREGKFVLSYKTPGGWVAITKSILTDVVGAGHDVRVTDLPPVAMAVLALMCPKLVRLPEAPPAD